MSLDSEQPKHHYLEMIIILGIYTILPFLLLYIYNQPSVDDFEYAARDKLNSFFATQSDTYYNWSGRYLATAVSRINPIRFGSWIGYKLGAFLLLLSFILTLHLFISALFNKLAIKQKLALTIFVIIIYFVQLPNISRGFYYLTHSFVYQLPNVLTLVMLLLLIKFFNLNDKTSKIIYAASITIVGIAIIGTNELSLIYIMTFLAFLLLHLWHQQHHALTFIIVIFTCSLIASLFMVLAPGNYVRMDYSSGDTGNIIWSILASAILIPTYFYKWGVLLIVSSILYVLLWQRDPAYTSSYKKIFRVPLGLSLSVFLITIFFMNFAYTWSVGAVPKPNVENVIYFYFVLGWFYNLQVAIETFNGQFLQTRFSFILVSTVMLLFARLIFNIDNNISTAYLDLLSGNAARHNRELNERHAFLSTSDCTICIVKPLSGMPKSLYIYDLTQFLKEAESPVNTAISRYWGKKGIYLSTQGPSGPPLEVDNLETLHSIGRKIKHRILGKGE